MAEIGRKIGLAVAFPLFVAALFLPAIYNHHPFLFPDSLGYLRSGEVALSATLGIDPVRDRPLPGPIKPPIPSPSPPDAASPNEPVDRGNKTEDGVSTERSVYYGIPVYVAERIGGEWLLPALQLLLSAVVMLALCRQFNALPLTVQLLAGAVAALLGGLSIFAGTVMPDVFGGLLVVGMAMYLVRWQSMTLVERAFWLLLILFAILVHKAHLAIGLGMLFVATALFLWRRIKLNPVWVLTGVFVAGALSHALVGIVVERTTGVTPRSAPFMLARLIADGTAVDYLRDECPRKKYVLCSHLHRLPVTEVDFLWSKDPAVGFEHVLPPLERDRMHAEASKIVGGTLERYPLRQLAASTRNVLRQYVTVGVTRFGRPDGLRPVNVNAPSSKAVLERYADSEVMQGRLPLTGWSGVMLAAYLLGLGFILFISIHRPKGLVLSTDQNILLFLLIAGIAVNGAVAGVLSAVVDRYQGRVAWIPVMLALIFAVQWLKSDKAGQTLKAVPRTQ